MHWHQLDLTLTRCSCLPSVQITCSYQSADCDTLQFTQGQIANKESAQNEKEDRPRIDTSKMHNQEKVEEFAHVLEEFLPGPSGTSALERWEHFRDAVYNAAMTVFGKKTSKSADCFEAHSDEMVPFMEEKLNAFAAYKACPSECDLQVLQAAQSKILQSAR